MFSNGGSGIDFRSLLCFIPGLDRRKAWHPKGELRTLVKSLSKEKVNTKRLTRRHVQYYGSSESDEDNDSDYHSTTHRFSIDEGDSCPPAFLMLPPRSEESTKDDTVDSGLNPTNNTGNHTPNKPAPEIVIHLLSDSESLTDRWHGGLITDESLDESVESLPHVESPTRSESTWVSPITDDHSHHSGQTESTQQQYVTCSEATAAGGESSDTETHSDSCSTCRTPDSEVVTPSDEHWQHAQNGWHSEESSVSVSAEVHKEPFSSQNEHDISKAQGEKIHAEKVEQLKLKPQQIIPSKTESPDTTPLSSSKHSINRMPQTSCPATPLGKQETEQSTDGAAKSPGSSDSQKTAHTVHSDRVETSTRTSTPKHVRQGIMRMDIEDLSSSNDSRSFSYVSVPKKTFVPDPDRQSNHSDSSESSEVSDTTFWSSDSDAVDEIAGIISKDPSTHRLAPEHSSQNTNGNMELNAQSITWKGDEDVASQNIGLHLAVQALVGKSTSSRVNPFNTPDALPLNGHCIVMRNGVSIFSYVLKKCERCATCARVCRSINILSILLLYYMFSAQH